MLCVMKSGKDNGLHRKPFNAVKPGDYDDFFA